MVARVPDLPVPWSADSAFAPGRSPLAGDTPARLAVRGQLLLERASALQGVSARGRGIPGFAGASLSIDGSACRVNQDCFIRDRMFAVVGDDGALCLRLPDTIVDDLVESGLGMRAGKNFLTWPVTDADQLETNWRILLHAYWQVTEFAPRKARRMWSEWVIRH